MSLSSDDDLDALLGVSFAPVERKPKATPVECGQSPPREKPRFTDWSDVGQFTFDGYVARVTRFHCRACDDLFDRLDGVFVSERKPNGTRRLQALAPNGDWPAKGPHRKEVTDAEVPFCGGCIGDLGFSVEVDAKGLPYTLVIRSQALPGATSPAPIPSHINGASS